MNSSEPENPITNPTRCERVLTNLWIVAGLYLILTFVMTFPLVLNFRSSTPDGSVDLWQNYWNFWWWKKCLLELHQSPFHTQYLFFPIGANMAFYTHSAFNMIAALPVTALLGPGAGYNFCIFLALWLSGLGTFLLVREVTGDVRAAFLGGLVFAFFPQHIEQTVEHLNLFSTEFMPIAVFFILRLIRRGGWINIAGLGVSFALNAMASWHLGILLTLTLAFPSAAALIRGPRPARKLARDLTLAGALAGLLLLPVMLPMLRVMAGGEMFFQKPPQDRGIDPMFLFLPSDRHPLFGTWTFSLYAARRAYGAAGFLCYLGWVPMGLAALALARRIKGAGAWAAGFGVALILALGARPWLGGELIEGLTLPFALMAKLPVLSLMRIANRFLIVASLALAVLAGLGWMAGRKRSDGKFVLLAALILLEYLWLPYPTRKVEFSPYDDRLAQAGGAGAVIDIPFNHDGHTVFNMVAQTRHNRPIAGGYLSTLPPESKQFIDADPMLSRLAGYGARGPDVPHFRGDIDREHLLALGFETVIMHKDRKEENWEKARRALDSRDLLGRKRLGHHLPLSDEQFDAIRRALTRACGPPVFEDGSIVAFSLVGPPEAGSPPQ